MICTLGEKNNTIGKVMTLAGGGPHTVQRQVPCRAEAGRMQRWILINHVIYCITVMLRESGPEQKEPIALMHHRMVMSSRLE